MKLNEKVLLGLIAAGVLASVGLVVAGAMRGYADIVTRNLTTLALFILIGSAVLTNVTTRQLRASVRALEADKAGRVSS